MATGLLLAYGVRVLLGSHSELRLRTGIWNYEEAVIDFSTESAAFAAHLRSAIATMAAGTPYDPDVDSGLATLTALEQAAVRQLCSDLRQAGLLVEADARERGQRMIARLTGNSRTVLEKPRPTVVVVADTPTVVDEVSRVLARFGATAVAPDPAIHSRLRTVDLTSDTETFAAGEHLEELAAALAGDVLAVCLSQPAVPLLRTLNRVLLHSGQPAVFGFPDGPFVSLLACHPPYTGCFECFEQRSLARLEDHVNYHEFVVSGLSRPATADPGGSDPDGADADGISPLMHVLSGLTATEAFMVGATGASRFGGRLLNVFLPTFEIQVQDVLRMPSCPACGVVARQRLQEINFSTRVAIDSVVSKILR